MDQKTLSLISSLFYVQPFLLFCVTFIMRQPPTFKKNPHYLTSDSAIINCLVSIMQCMYACF